MKIKGIDGIDNEIVNLLLQNGRISYSEIASKVSLTRTAVKNRVSALEKQGIIAGYRAVIQPQNAPEMMTFLVNVETTAEHFENAKAFFGQTEEVLTLVQTTGNCHLTAICVASDVKAMRDFITSVYKRVEGITSINAHAVLDVIKGTIIPEK